MFANLYDNAVVVQLVVHPIDEDLDEIPEPGVFVGARLDHRPLFVLLQLIFLQKDLCSFKNYHISIYLKAVL
jgi:hypothetical protein